MEPSRKKNAWESALTGNISSSTLLDPNLLDSDFFEGRGNLQGIYAAVAYGLTDNMIATVRYGYAETHQRQPRHRRQQPGHPTNEPDPAIPTAATGSDVQVLAGSLDLVSAHLSAALGPKHVLLFSDGAGSAPGELFSCLINLLTINHLRIPLACLKT